MERGRICYTWRCVYPLLFYPEAHGRGRAGSFRFPLNFVRLSFRSRVTLFPPWPSFFFCPPPRLFLRIYLALKQKIGANSRARARLIVHSYRGKLILHHRRTFLLFSFRFASFLHSARSCRQQSDQGWKLGPGGSAPWVVFKLVGADIPL